MIARVWSGSARVGHARQYLDYLEQHTMPALTAIDGYRGAYVLRRDRPDGLDQFLVVTLWDSLDAIRRFAGADAEAAVVPGEAQAHLFAYEDRAVHYEVMVAPAAS